MHFLFCSHTALIPVFLVDAVKIFICWEQLNTVLNILNVEDADEKVLGLCTIGTNTLCMYCFLIILLSYYSDHGKFCKFLFKKIKKHQLSSSIP